MSARRAGAAQPRLAAAPVASLAEQHRWAQFAGPIGGWFNVSTRKRSNYKPAVDVSLCEEAVFQSLSSLRLSSVPLERLMESLPGQRVDHKSLEKLKKTCSPQQQVLHLLRLCPFRYEPLREESFPLQRPQESDPGRPPEGHQQPAGGQSSAGGRARRGLRLPAEAVHPAAAPPLEDGQPRAGRGQGAVPQPEGAARPGGAALPAEGPEEDRPHHRNHLRAQDVREDVRQHAARRVVF